MSWSLGIDTSNYTTSVAAWNSSTNEIVMEKAMLSVDAGKLGLRQSDAVFRHTTQLGELIEVIMRQVDALSVVGASVAPRDKEGSYMPCFLVGKLAADIVSCTNKIPSYSFSHQAGHIAAVLYGANKTDLLGSKFIAFHLSGGTTECLYVSPGKTKPFITETIGESLDLFAGQAVDRIGQMLGLSFPSGALMEELAKKSVARFNIKPYFRDGNPSLSGIENQAKQLIQEGRSKEDVSKFCIDFIYEIVNEMTKIALNKYPDLPVIYAGGVMSNSIIRKRIQIKYNAFFAPPSFSTDNAAGIAVLAGIEHNKTLRKDA